MTFLPIVERELRVAARRRGTYWNRLYVALLAIALGAWMMFVMRYQTGPQLSLSMFGTLSGLAFLYCLVAGVQLTSDSLSEEKREGTMGLLFLTDLKGYDVILGKLSANSVTGFYGLIAIFPVLAIPLLLGGLTQDEFWRMNLVLVNTLFFSLSAGVLASSLCKDARKAMVLTLVFIMLPTAILPAIGAGYAEYYQLNTVDPAFLYSSPASSYGGAYAVTYTRMNQLFWTSIIVTQVMAWVCLAVASLVTPRSWQDRPASARRARMRDVWYRWSFGDSTQRATFRKRLLDINPICWLSGRDRLKVATIWAVLGGLTCLWAWGAVKFRNDWLDEGMCLFTAWVITTMFKCWVATESCRRFLEDRRSGALELLLSTPLQVREIIHGQWLALLRQFGWPLAFIIGADIALFLIPVARAGSFARVDDVWGWLLGSGLIMLVADFIALYWVGMWVGLTAKQASRATTAVMARVLALPWCLFIGFMLLTAMTTFWVRVDFGDHFLFILWIFIGLAVDIFMIIRCRHRLYTRLRELATERGDGAKKRGWWFLGGKKTDVPASAG